MTAQNCQRCDLVLAAYHVDVCGQLVRVCGGCLTETEKAVFEAAQLDPRDVVESLGANI